jgi:hypothetical protein
VLAILSGLQQTSQGVAVADRALVPLWIVRPKTATTGGHGSSAAADRDYPDPTRTGGPNPIWVTGSQGMLKAGQDAAPQYYTKDAAEAYWLDMTDKEHTAFADAAEKAGFWKPSQGQDALVAAWGHAVSLAEQYNANKQNQSDWLSPFEAVNRLAVKAMADGDQSHDGFSTQTTIKQYSQGELLGQARQILQSELGRNPTESEMKAYTAAVNLAARNNPTIVTGQTIDNGDGSTNQNQVVGAQVDPGAIITGMAENTQEHDQYQAATTYYQALLGALDSVVQM